MLSTLLRARAAGPNPPQPAAAPSTDAVLEATYPTFAAPASVSAHNPGTPVAVAVDVEGDPPSWLSTGAGPMLYNGVASGSPSIGLIAQKSDSEAILGPGTWAEGGIMAPLVYSAAAAQLVMSARATRAALQSPQGLYAYAASGPLIRSKVVRVNDDGACPVVEISVRVENVDLSLAAEAYAAAIGNPEVRLLANPAPQASAFVIPLWLHIGVASDLKLPLPGAVVGLHLSLGVRSPQLRPTPVTTDKRLADLLEQVGLPKGR